MNEAVLPSPIPAPYSHCFDRLWAVTDRAVKFTENNMAQSVFFFLFLYHHVVVPNKMKGGKWRIS